MVFLLQRHTGYFLIQVDHHRCTICTLFFTIITITTIITILFFVTILRSSWSGLCAVHTDCNPQLGWLLAQQVHQTFHGDRNQQLMMIMMLVMVMMMMVMVMVMIMHFNDREATSDRITLGVTAVLTLSAISLDSRSDLPKVIIHSHHPTMPVAFSLFWHSLKTENQSEVINHSQPAALSFPSSFLSSWHSHAFSFHITILILTPGSLCNCP